MITPSNLLHLPYTRDLTEAGIAYALRSLPHMFNRMGASPYDKLRRTVAGAWRWSWRFGGIFRSRRFPSM
jgi:hypothetical protein